MKSSEFITESKGQATAALRKVVKDLGNGIRIRTVYSDKRQFGRRVKATMAVLGKEYAPGRFQLKDPDPFPTQEQVEALVKKHFAGMDVFNVVVHERNPDRWNDMPYIAVSVRNPE